MSDVKRYAPCSHDYEAIMEESAHGGYVRGRDYEELRAQLKARGKDVAVLRNAIKRVCHLRVGQYSIMAHIDGGHWIEIAEGASKGEGMQTDDLPELIDKFYTEHF